VTWFNREHDAVQPLVDTPEDLWIGRYNRAGTCVPAICAAVRWFGRTSLEVLEIGAGYNSTPVLAAAVGHEGFVVTFESDEQWVEIARAFSDDPESVVHDPNGAGLSAAIAEAVRAKEDDHGGVDFVWWDLALVDHWTPNLTREQTVCELRRVARVILVHDADDAWMEANRELVESFKSWRRYDRLSPETVILSDFEDLSGMVL
jgi:hypothetical protein